MIDWMIRHKDINGEKIMYPSVGHVFIFYFLFLVFLSTCRLEYSVKPQQLDITVPSQRILKIIEPGVLDSYS
jgi:hypothetical protein